MSQYDSQLDDLLAEPPVWPKVIGIISIVWASLGIFCTGCGALGGVFGMQALKANPEVGELPPTMEFGPVDFALGGIGLALAILLLVGGIFLLSRKPSSRPIHIFYALASIAVSIGATVNAFGKMEAMNKWVQENPDSMFAGAGSTGAPAMAGAFIGAVVGLAYPAFLLVWFLFVKKKSTDITGTGLPPAA